MSDAVTQEAAAIAALVGQVNANAAAIDTGLRNRLQALNVSLTAEPGKLLVILANAATAAAAAAQQQAQAVGSVTLDRKAPAAARDAAVAQTRDLLRGTRDALASRFGPEQVAQAFPAGAIPKQADALSSYTAQVISRLPTQAATWTAVRSAVQVDVNAVVAELTQSAAALTAALQGLNTQAGARTGATAERTGAVEVMHELHKGLLHMLVGLLEASGETERSEHVSLHHHASHPKAAAAVPAISGA